MIAACRAADVPLWVGYYRRALPRFIAVRDLVESGAIGKVRMAVARQFQPLPPAEQLAAGTPWRIDPALSGGGFFFEAVCHTLDILDYLFGPVGTVRAFAANQAGAYKPEDVVSASLRFASRGLRQRRVVLRGGCRRGIQRDRRRQGPHPLFDVQARADPRLPRRQPSRSCPSAILRMSTSR